MAAPAAAAAPSSAFTLFTDGRRLDGSDGLRLRIRLRFVCGLVCRYWLWLLHDGRGWDFIEVLVLVLQFHEVGNIKKGIALQADVHECGLHSGENASDASFVN